MMAMSNQIAQLRSMAARKLDRPIFILSSPRSGSSLLFETLSQARGVFTIGGESHSLIENIPGLHPRSRGWSSNYLSKADAKPAIVDLLASQFYAFLRDRDGRAPTGSAQMIEKTPKNILRVGFLNEAFPDARYVFLYRDVRETLSSMLEAWMSGRFQTYPNLPGWTTTPWSLLLVAGWRDLKTLPLPEIVARQWVCAMTTLLDDLEILRDGQVIAISYSDFLASPQTAVSKLCTSLDIEWDHKLPAILPLSPTVISAPRQDKWLTNRLVVEALRPIVAEVDARAQSASRRLGK